MWQTLSSKVKNITHLVAPKVEDDNPLPEILQNLNKNLDIPKKQNELDSKSVSQSKNNVEANISKPQEQQQHIHDGWDDYDVDEIIAEPSNQQSPRILLEDKIEEPNLDMQQQQKQSDTKIGNSSSSNISQIGAIKDNFVAEMSQDKKISEYKYTAELNEEDIVALKIQLANTYNQMNEMQNLLNMEKEIMQEKYDNKLKKLLIEEEKSNKRMKILDEKEKELSLREEKITRNEKFLVNEKYLDELDQTILDLNQTVFTIRNENALLKDELNTANTQHATKQDEINNLIKVHDRKIDELKISGEKNLQAIEQSYNQKLKKKIDEIAFIKQNARNMSKIFTDFITNQRKILSGFKTFQSDQIKILTQSFSKELNQHKKNMQYIFGASTKELTEISSEIERIKLREKKLNETSEASKTEYRQNLHKKDAQIEELNKKIAEQEKNYTNEKLRTEKMIANMTKELYQTNIKLVQLENEIKDSKLKYSELQNLRNNEGIKHKNELENERKNKDQLEHKYKKQIVEIENTNKVVIDDLRKKVIMLENKVIELENKSNLGMERIIANEKMVSLENKNELIKKNEEYIAKIQKLEDENRNLSTIVTKLKQKLEDLDLSLHKKNINLGHNHETNSTNSAQSVKSRKMSNPDEQKVSAFPIRENKIEEFSTKVHVGNSDIKPANTSHDEIQDTSKKNLRIPLIKEPTNSDEKEYYNPDKNKEESKSGTDLDKEISDLQNSSEKILYKGGSLIPEVSESRNLPSILEGMDQNSQAEIFADHRDSLLFKSDIPNKTSSFQAVLMDSLKIPKGTNLPEISDSKDILNEGWLADTIPLDQILDVEDEKSDLPKQNKDEDGIKRIVNRSADIQNEVADEGWIDEEVVVDEGPTSRLLPGDENQSNATPRKLSEKNPETPNMILHGDAGDKEGWLDENLNIDLPDELDNIDKHEVDIEKEPLLNPTQTKQDFETLPIPCFGPALNSPRFNNIIEAESSSSVKHEEEKRNIKPETINEPAKEIITLNSPNFNIEIQSPVANFGGILNTEEEPKDIDDKCKDIPTLNSPQFNTNIDHPFVKLNEVQDNQLPENPQVISQEYKETFSPQLNNDLDLDVPQLELPAKIRLKKTIQHQRFMSPKFKTTDAQKESDQGSPKFRSMVNIKKSASVDILNFGNLHVDDDNKIESPKFKDEEPGRDILEAKIDSPKFPENAKTDIQLPEFGIKPESPKFGEEQDVPKKIDSPKFRNENESNSPKFQINQGEEEKILSPKFNQDIKQESPKFSQNKRTESPKFNQEAKQESPKFNQDQRSGSPNFRLEKDDSGFSKPVDQISIHTDSPKFQPRIDEDIMANESPEFRKSKNSSTTDSKLKNIDIVTDKDQEKKAESPKFQNPFENIGIVLEPPKSESLPKFQNPFEDLEQVTEPPKSDPLFQNIDTVFDPFKDNNLKSQGPFYESSYPLSEKQEVAKDSPTFKTFQDKGGEFSKKELSPSGINLIKEPLTSLISEPLPRFGTSPGLLSGSETKVDDDKSKKQAKKQIVINKLDLRPSPLSLQIDNQSKSFQGENNAKPINETQLSKSNLLSPALSMDKALESPGIQAQQNIEVRLPNFGVGIEPTIQSKDKVNSQEFSNLKESIPKPVERMTSSLQSKQQQQQQQQKQQESNPFFDELEKPKSSQPKGLVINKGLILPQVKKANTVGIGLKLPPGKGIANDDDIDLTEILGSSLKK